MSDGTPERTKPGFDEWVDYCFTRGMSDFWDFDPKNPEMARCVDDIATDTLVDHLVLLFEGPYEHLGRFNDRQIAEGIRFILGMPSEFFPLFYDEQVGTYQNATPDQSIRVYRALSDFFVDYLDTVCKDVGTVHANRTNEWTEIDRAVFGVWDSRLGCIFRDISDSRTFDAAIELAGRVLGECECLACTWGLSSELSHMTQNKKIRDVLRQHD